MRDVYQVFYITPVQYDIYLITNANPYVHIIHCHNSLLATQPFFYFFIFNITPKMTVTYKQGQVRNAFLLFHWVNPTCCKDEQFL